MKTVSFIYPIFLAAGLLLAIPVLIHLFNLRRYKTVYFPHTRFLKNIQLRSQKQSQVRYKWLLISRLLFLTLLILAFAQPFFSNSKKTDTRDRMQVIYVDNSGSMSLKKGPQRLLDVAKAAARRQVKNANPGTKFLLLTNDKPVSYRPIPADKVLAEISNIELSSIPGNAAHVLSVMQGVMNSEAVSASDLYYYSDFQQSAVNNVLKTDEDINVFAIPLKGTTPANIYIDTAYLAGPVLQPGESNQLIIHTKASGDADNKQPVLNLLVNGQVKSAATIDFDDVKERTDTLSFRVSDAGWQEIELVIDDEAVRFDDTFRITARSTPSLSVLALNEGSPSPYIQAAFRAYNGFRLNNVNISNPPADWSEYSLVIVNNCTAISSQLGKQLATAQQAGRSVFIIPGRTANYTAINEGLKEIGEISISKLDTASQTAGTLQQGSDMVRDMFEKIPDNVQLPTANWHYVMDAGLTANQQSVLSFRNGDPLLAQYKPSLGQLYILGTAIDMQSGNFQSSYFFAPFLYRMAVMSGGGNVYALTLGRQQAAFIPLSNADERNMVHLYHNGIDAIPQQRTYGAGLNVSIDGVVTTAGFYPLAANGSDTTVIAVNSDRMESDLATTNPAELDDLWQGLDVQVTDVDNIGTTSSYNAFGSFPLWKVCAILAVLMLAVETWFLTGSLRKPTAASQ